ncbi:TetR/AcrR family transcriptional regulator [Spirillospora sp. CA-255316]
MTSPRRRGTENSKTRFLLLDTAERLMLEEGYAAVGIRRVAREADVTPALVNYYFPSLDDLFLAVLRRRAEQEFAMQSRALESAQPLRALWKYSSHPAGATLMMEFTALSNHRKVIRQELASYAERFRNAQIESLDGYLKERGIDTDELHPLAVLVVISAISRIFVMESTMGLTTGHAETLDLIERSVLQIDGPPATPKDAK